MLKNIVKAIEEGKIDEFKIAPSPLMHENIIILIKKGDKRYRRYLTENGLSFIDDFVDCMLEEIIQEDK